MRAVARLGLAVALAALSSAHAAGAEAACAIELAGDEGIVEGVAEILREADDVTGRTCRRIEARIDRRGSGFVVSVADTFGRTVQREVSDAASAAWVIESWARIDLVTGLLDALEDSAPRPALASAPSGLPKPITPVVAASDDAPGGPALGAAPLDLGPASLAGPLAGPERTMSLRAELGIASDGALTTGASARASQRLGVFEPTLLARFGRGASGRTAEHDHTTRLELELGAGLDLPLDLGFVALRPGFVLAVGALWSSRGGAGAGCAEGAASSVRGAGEPGPGPRHMTTATCPSDVVVFDDFVHESFAPRAELHLAATARVLGGLGLDLDLSGSYSVLADRDPIAPRYAEGLLPHERALLSLAPEPAWTARAALGVRWEGP